MAPQDPQELFPTWFPLLGFTILSILVSNLLTALDPQSEVFYDGFKRSKYIGSLLWQFVVLPICMILMLVGDMPMCSSELITWAKRGKEGFSSVPAYYFAALAATQLKDFIMGPVELWRSKKMFVHHVVVLIASLYAEHLPQGYGNFVLSSYVLELGSAWFNFCSIFPDSKFCWYMYHGAIVASHVLAACGFFAMIWYDKLSITERVLFGLSGIGVMIGRQMVSRSWWKKGFEYHKVHIHDVHGGKTH